VKFLLSLVEGGLVSLDIVAHCLKELVGILEISLELGWVEVEFSHVMA
jgi:hypothetical protein